MFYERILTSVFELFLMIVLACVIISVVYGLFKIDLIGNRGFDTEEELKKGNVAVGILMATIMVCSAIMLQRGAEASIGMFRLAVMSPASSAMPYWQIALLTFGHLVLTLAIVRISIFAPLRLFGIMVRKLTPDFHLKEQMQKGNIAVGLLLAAIVFISMSYVGNGVSALTKALVPQPTIGKLQIME